MSRKPVLFYLMNNLNHGGIQARVRGVAPIIAEHYNLHIVTYKEKGVFYPELADLGCTMHHCPIRSKVNPFILNNFTKLLQKNKAELIHNRSHTANVKGTWAAWRAGVPVRMSGVHTLRLHWFSKSPFQQRKQQFIENTIHRNLTHALFHVSQESIEYFAPFYPQSVRDKCVLLHNGIDFSRLVQTQTPEELRVNLGIAATAPIAGYIGRLVPEKRVEKALEWIAMVQKVNPEWHGVFVGEAEPEYQAVLQEYVNRCPKPENIHFVGNSKTPGNYYALFSVLLFSSPPQQEGMPGVALEAAAFGVPILTTPIGPLLELTQYYSGISFIDTDYVPNPANGSVNSEQEIATLFNQYANVSANSRRFDAEKVRAHFSVDAMAERLLFQYNRLHALHGKK